MPTRLKRNVATIEDVEEQFRSLYVVKDDKAVLDLEVEGLVPAQKLDEMRNTNITERQRHEQEMEKFKDIDPEKYRDLLAREKDLEEGKLVKRGELEQVRKNAIDEAMRPWHQKEREWTDKEQKLRNRLEQSIIESKAVEAALPMGLRKGAAKDLIARAHEIFKVNDDYELVAYQPDGKEKYHLGDPYTIEQFVKDLSNAEDGKHLFEANAGGGGEPGANRFRGRDFIGEINPWDPKTTNLTLQGEILTKDRPKAIRMAAKFGIRIPEHQFANAAA